MPINDAHCHFFSPRFFDALMDELVRAGARKAGETGAALAGTLAWEIPTSTEALADRWAAELDRRSVARAALIASVPGDEESVAAAIARHPSRFVGFFMLNAAAPDAVDRARRALGELGLRCVCLFPAAHHYRLDDPAVVKVFEVAAELGGAVFAHCGVLSMGVRRRLGLPSPFDLRLGDPLTLCKTAATFPGVPVIIPHFAAGFTREGLMAADICPNIHFDTSSSNAWLKYHPEVTLAEVFTRAIEVLGPDRILFGTDSSFFPRGWHAAIHDEQTAILQRLKVPAADEAKMMGGNFEKLFPRS